MEEGQKARGAIPHSRGFDNYTSHHEGGDVGTAYRLRSSDDVEYQSAEIGVTRTNEAGSLRFFEK